MTRFLPRLLAVAGLVLTAAPAAAVETLSFAPLPMETPETVVKQVKPMLSYLEARLGVTLRIEYSPDYTDILDKFRAGTVDLAYLGPLPYLTLRDAYADAEPVVHFLETSGKATYTCAIVAPTDGPTSLADMNGRRVALTQPLSTCGYLSTSGLLRAAGSELERNLYRYLDAHDEVALAVARGEFDIGGLKTAIARKYAHLGLTVLAETAPLPSFALVANARTVPPERIADLRRELVGLTAGDSAMAAWGDNLRHGAVPAADSDYDSLRRLRGTAPIPLKGNF